MQCSFLNEVELVVCNGTKLVVEPDWMRVRPNRLCCNRCSANGSITEYACRNDRYRMFKTLSSMNGIR